MPRLMLENMLKWLMSFKLFDHVESPLNDAFLIDSCIFYDASSPSSYLAALQLPL